MAKSISIDDRIYDTLEAMKAPGQSFGGVIQELINEREQAVMKIKSLEDDNEHLAAMVTEAEKRR